MDLTPYVEHLRRDLQQAAVSAGPEAEALAERLGYALDATARLALMEAISHACAEITTDLAGEVSVQLQGRDLAFRVESPLGAGLTPPAPPTPPHPPAPPAAPDAAGPDLEDEGTLARISLRIPESLKARAEEAAAEAGQSLNTWLVGVVRDATRSGAIRVDVDLSSIPFLSRDSFPFEPGARRRMTGWA